MLIVLLPDSMRITIEDNTMLTTIVKLVDGTPLRWHTLTDTSVFVAGKKELLYELLSELTTVYLGIIEII